MRARNRSRIEIMVDILVAVNTDRQYGTSITKLMARVQTSYEGIKRHIAELQSAELVVYHSAENLYTVTDKGRRLVTLWTQVIQMLTPQQTK